MIKLLAEQLEEKGIRIDEDVIDRVLRKIEEESWEYSLVASKVYQVLRERALNILSSALSEAREKLEDIRQSVREKVELYAVRPDKSDIHAEAIGADASSFPMPLGLLRVALMSGVAVRYASNQMPKYVVKSDVIQAAATFDDIAFAHLCGARRESLLPCAAIRQIQEEGMPEFIVIDGPLSISQWYVQHYDRPEVREAVDSLIESRAALIEMCRKEDIPLIAIVKRSRTTYFHHYFELDDRHTDQFLFHNVLEIGQRTESISITHAIRHQSKSKPILVDKLPCDIYGFYVQTSTNPLVPPLRVEYPAHFCDREDEVAGYVLGTAVSSNNPDYDGLPKAQCMAHREAKVTKRVMSEILKEQLSRLARESPDSTSLMGLVRWRLE